MHHQVDDDDEYWELDDDEKQYGPKVPKKPKCCKDPDHCCKKLKWQPGDISR